MLCHALQINRIRICPRRISDNDYFVYFPLSFMIESSFTKYRFCATKFCDTNIQVMSVRGEASPSMEILAFITHRGNP